VIDDREATALDVPPSLLGRGKYQMAQLGDAPGRDDDWQREEKVVQRGDPVRLALRPSEGCVIELAPQK